MVVDARIGVPLTTPVAAELLTTSLDVYLNHTFIPGHLLSLNATPAAVAATNALTEVLREEEEW